MNVRNTERYLAAVVEEFRQDTADGYSDEFEAKKRLWHAAVIVFEVAGTPGPWIDELREIALDAIKPRRIENTIRSAGRRAAGNAR